LFLVALFPPLDSNTGPPPGGFVASDDASFQFNSNEAGTFSCSLDGVASTCGSPKSYSDLEEGEHTFSVRAIDVAGNLDSSSASRTWTVDLTAPETTLEPTAGPAEGATVASRSASFAYSADEPGSFECTLDGVDRACAAPIAGLADGPHTFTVRARDRAGTPDQTPATRTWSVDATPPQTRIAKHPQKRTSKRRGSFAFAASEEGAVFECRLDRKPFRACATAASFRVGPGRHKLQVRASDALGNADASPAAWTWTVKRKRR
jgi:hypothetical protein